MQGPRVSLASLMVVVAVVAFDLTIGRALHSYYGRMAFVLALSGLALQVGLFELVKNRGRDRMFWAGFVGASSLALMSYVWEESVPNNNTVFGSPWLNYMRAVDRCLPALSFRTSPRGWPVMLAATNSVVLFLPQLLVGSAGGILFRVVSRRRSPAGAFAVEQPPSFPRP